MFNGVTKYYKNVPGIVNLSFSLNKGELIRILGTNGSGKTTVFRVLLKLLESNLGSINLEDRDIRDIDSSFFGYLPEERSLYKDLTVYQQIQFFGSIKNLKKHQIEESLNYWLDYLKIKNYKHCTVKTLSKGNQQKVQLICSIIHNPLIVIFDEPFSGLDIINIQLFQRLLQKLKEENKYILISSHNYEYLDDLCDKIILLKKGETLLNDSLLNLRSLSKQYYLTVPKKKLNYYDVYGVEDVYFLGNKVRLTFKDRVSASKYLKDEERNTNSFSLEQATVTDFVRSYL